MKIENPDFVKNDEDIYPVVNCASDDERGMLAKIMAERKTSHVTEYTRSPMELVYEIQRMGGHSIANTWRGHGVRYREIVQDVAKKVRVDLKGIDEIGAMEWQIARKLFEDAEAKLSEEQRKELFEELRERAEKEGVEVNIKNLTTMLICTGSPKVPIPIQHLIVGAVSAQVVARVGVTALIGGGIPGALALGPIGWALGAVWVAYDLGGPAYSVTLPFVLLLTSLRTNQRKEDVVKELGGE